MLGQTGVWAKDAKPTHVIEVQATTREERTRILELGYAIDEVRSDKVFLLGSPQVAEDLEGQGFHAKAVAFPPKLMSVLRASGRDTTRYHSYQELQTDLQALQTQYPALVTLSSMGRTTQNRDMPIVRISGKTPAQASEAKLPVILFMGCHHAREYLSVEMPLMLAKHLTSQYGHDANITRLLDSREVYIAPMINPDGHTYDFNGTAEGNMWRKNRRRNGGNSYGVDLNRNYGFKWGTGGSSSDPSSDTYKGPEPFSEPETRAVRDFVDSQPRMTTLLSFHSFSELILYPWGHSSESIGVNDGDAADLPVFEKMANTMSNWNGYTPEQASALYIASGDTTDWAYGAHRIIAFTFELYPKSMYDGGFYPGDGAIDPTFQENIRPMLYLMEYADNPRRVMSERVPQYLHTSTPARRGVPVANFRDAF